jgi:chromosome condensin MukBEF complex kleisin-like MukF subunit
MRVLILALLLASTFPLAEMLPVAPDELIAKTETLTGDIFSDVSFFSFEQLPNRIVINIEEMMNVYFM